MKRVVVGSANPVKIRAVLLGLQQMFPDPEEFVVSGVSTDSGIGHQPFGEGDTLRGAHNRAGTIRYRYPDADFWFGIEAGVVDGWSDMEAFAFVVAISHEGRTNFARTATFRIPPKIADLVRQGRGLGGATDEFFQRNNSKQEESIVDMLTDGVIDRTHLYAPAVVLALIPFKHPELYPRQ